MVTDYDCWHPDHDHVTVDAVVKVMNQNAEKARRLIMNVSGKLGPWHTSAPEIERVLDTAIITAPDRRDAKLLKRLDAVAGRVLAKPPPVRAKPPRTARKR